MADTATKTDQIRNEDQRTDFANAQEDLTAEDVQENDEVDTDKVEDGLVPGTNKTPVQLLSSGEQRNAGNVSLIDEQGVLEGGGELQLTGLFAEVNPIADEPEPEFVGKRSVYIHDEPGVSPSKIQAGDTPNGVNTKDGNKSYDDLDFEELDEERHERVRSSRNTSTVDTTKYAEATAAETHDEDATGATSAEGAAPPETRADASLEDIRDRQVAQAEAVADGAEEEARRSPTDSEQSEPTTENIEDHQRDTQTVGNAEGEGYDEEARRAELDDLTKGDLHEQYDVSENQSKGEMIDEIIANEQS